MLVPLAVFLLAIAPVAAAATKTVQITRSGFSPATTTVTVGDTVTFRNADTQNHQVVANDGSFVSAVLTASQSYSTTFPTARTVHYHDGLNAQRKGTVVVQAPATVLSLAATSQTVVYESSTTLTGSLSTKLSGQSVSLLAQPTGAKTAQKVNVVTSDANGAYSFTVAPTIQTVYRVEWKSTTSPGVTVYVAPRVGFGLSGRIYTVKVTSDIAYGGHYAYVQRRNALGAWVNVRKVFLSSTYSRARFTMRLARGQSFLRVWLPASQAGSGYVQSLSRTVIVTKR